MTTNALATSMTPTRARSLRAIEAELTALRANPHVTVIDDLSPAERHYALHIAGRVFRAGLPSLGVRKWPF
jgi:hypothetical protein